MSKMKTTAFTVQLDRQLKQDAEILFDGLGMTLSDAILLFLRQAVQVQGIPFEIRNHPNKTTVEAMKEAIAIANDPNAKTFASAAEMIQATEL